MQPRMIYVAFTSNDTRAQAMDIVSDLRERGYITDYDFYGRPLRRQIEDGSCKRSSTYSYRRGKRFLRMAA